VGTAQAARPQVNPLHYGRNGPFSAFDNEGERRRRYMGTKYKVDQLDQRAIAEAIVALVLPTRNQKDPEKKDANQQYVERVFLVASGDAPNS
jgi:hypothetical protein